MDAHSALECVAQARQHGKIYCRQSDHRQKVVRQPGTLFAQPNDWRRSAGMVDMAYQGSHSATVLRVGENEAGVEPGRSSYLLERHTRFRHSGILTARSLDMRANASTSPTGSQRGPVTRCRTSTPKCVPTRTAVDLMSGTERRPHRKSRPQTPVGTGVRNAWWSTSCELPPRR